MNGEGENRQLPQSLEKHLRNENPLLADVVKSFRKLDKITRQLGFFNREESHTSHIPWWPLISILGTYSSGKSAFINTFLKYPLQTTGNQAVDDKFTIICFTSEDQVRSLPGLALDADPRFPLFKISKAIDEVAKGQSAHIDKYLQLKTCPSEKLRGQILIDSPGFDADEQRSSTLRNGGCDAFKTNYFLSGCARRQAGEVGQICGYEGHWRSHCAGEKILRRWAG